MKKYLIISTLLLTNPSPAQIVTDGTLGQVVTLPAPNYVISDTLGQQVGTNLFHSFQTFTLNNGESATFTGSPTVKNILARVTGGHHSFIDGTLRSTIPNAHLYLLNPYGILFGENAKLDVQGSFHASTADYLRLGEEGYFSARFPNQSVLTVAPPSAFGFLDNPAPISIQGSFLQVPDRQALSIIGGNIQIKQGNEYGSTLYTQDGQIYLAAVDSAGEVLPTSSDLHLSSFEKLGKVMVSHGSSQRHPMLVNGELLQIEGEILRHGNLDVSGAGGGQIFMRAGELLLKQGWLFADTYGNRADTGIDIAIDGKIALFNDARISANNAGSGDSGVLTIKATEVLQLSNSSILTDNISLGKGANIKINVPLLTLSQLSAIQTTTLRLGNAGNIKIEAQQINLQNRGLIYTTTLGQGNAGNIKIEAQQINLQNGGFINTATDIGSKGQAGEIFINATESISLNYFSSISSATGQLSSGNAGNITLTTPQLKLSQAAEINSFSYGVGNAGTIQITADNVSLTDKSNIVTEANQAGGGNITFQLQDSLYVNKSRITAETEGTQPRHHGGNLSITQPQFITLNNSQLNASAYAGNGGNIEISADHFLQSSDSILDASSELGIDGNIQINAPDEDIGDSLGILSQQFLDATSLFRKSCVARARDKSYFVEKGTITTEDSKAFQSTSLSKLSKTERLAAYYTLKDKWNTAKRKGDKLAMSQALGQLALLYEQEQRYEEALRLNQQALTMMESYNAAYWRYQWQWQRGRLLKALGKPKPAIFYYQAAINTLAPIRQALIQLYQDNGRSEFQEVLKPLFTELVALFLQQATPLPNGVAKNQVLKQAIMAMDLLKAATLQDYFKDDCIKPTTELEEIDPSHTAIIYPIFITPFGTATLDSSQLVFVISLPEGMRQIMVPVRTERLLEEIEDLYAQLICQSRDCRTNHHYRKPAQQLYDWLLRPLEDMLPRDQIHTLVFVPDGAFYQIPMTVLYDGEQFLVEKYAVVITPGMTLTEPSHQSGYTSSGFASRNSSQTQFLYSVLTQSNNPSFAPLEHYAISLQDVFKHTFGNITVLAGKNFVMSKLSRALYNTPYSLVHLFSHAQFAGNVNETFIVTFNDKLSMDKLESLISPRQFSDTPLDLLVLSACETAKGDERAALGLAGVAYKAGARSALATLWAIQEETVYQLFKGFYPQLTHHSKAQALQQAQIQLLNHPNFSHPHDWAGFVLIGNWL